MGFLVSPYNDKEGEKFAKVASLISVFLSGHLLSQLESSVKFIFQDAKLITNTLYGVRLLVFAICMMSTPMMTYIYRLYLDLERSPEDAPKDGAVPKDSTPKSAPQ